MRTRGAQRLILIVADGEKWAAALIAELAWERCENLRDKLAVCDNSGERAKLTRDLCRARALYDQVEG